MFTYKAQCPGLVLSLDGCPAVDVLLPLHTRAVGVAICRQPHNGDAGGSTGGAQLGWKGPHSLSAPFVPSDPQSAGGGSEPLPFPGASMAQKGARWELCAEQFL